MADFFKSNGLEVIDKRENGGCLWVAGSQDQLAPYLAKANEQYGASGGFTSGRTTKQRMDWYTKSDKKKYTIETPIIVIEEERIIL